MLPNSPLDDAAEVAERLRGAIPLALPAEEPADEMPRVTVSIGVTVADPASWDLDTYPIHADQALYAAKRAGRNTVWIVTPEDQRRPARTETADYHYC